MIERASQQVDGRIRWFTLTEQRMLKISENKQQLPDDEVRRLLSKHRAGCTDAGWELAISQQRLIAKICSRYNGYLGIDTDELVQEFTLNLYCALDDFDPLTTNLRNFTIRLMNRAGMICRKLACRPLVKSTCDKFGQDVEYFIEDYIKPESNYNWVMESLRDLDDAADACSRITPEGVFALKLLAKGCNQTEIRDRLLERFPDALSGKGKWRNRLSALINGSMQDLREVLGTESPARTYQNTVNEETFRLFINRVLENHKLSPKAASADLLKFGVRLSYGSTYRFFREFAIREKQRTVAQNPKVRCELVESTVAEWQAKRTRPILPTADESRMSDAMWDEIRQLIPQPTGVGPKYRNVRAKTDGVIYYLRNRCRAIDVPTEFCSNGEQVTIWKGTLEKLGVLDEVLKISAGNEGGK